MKKVIVETNRSHEDLARKEFEDLSEAVAWLRANPDAYDHDIRRVEMYYLPTYIDVDAAMAEG